MDAYNMTDIDNTDLFFKERGKSFENLGVMGAKIAYYNFQWRYIALVIFLSNKYSTAMDTFLSHYNKTVAIRLGKFNSQYKNTVPQFVLFGEETSELSEYLRWLVDQKFDNTGKFIIICYSKDFQKCDEEHIFKTLAEIYILDAIFLRTGDNDDEPVPFTYHMILPDKCKNDEPEIMDLRNDCVDDGCFKAVYDEKLHDLHKCPLIVSTFEQPPFMYLHNGTEEPTGGDGDILKVVTHALNATLIIKTPTDGDDWGHYENNNWTGSMGDVFNDRAHLSVCSLPLTTHKYGNFQISFIYNTMDIIWVAKLPDLKPAWEKLIRPFNFRARIAVAITFMGVMILGGFIKTDMWRKVSESLNIGYPKQSLLFYSWVIFLGQSILKEPSKRRYLVIMYSWIWFCFVIRSCYQAALMGSLKNNVYQNNFKSFKEVLESKHTYGGQNSYKEYFVDDTYIYDNWVQLKYREAHKMLSKISNGTSNFVLAANKEIVIEYLLEHNGTRRVQMIPLKILNSPTVMYLRKYSPLAAPLNTALSRAVESGFTAFWHMRFKRQRKHLFQHYRSREPEMLKLQHFAGCLGLLLVGWMVSIIFFILEVYCGKIEIND